MKTVRSQIVCPDGTIQAVDLPVSLVRQDSFVATPALVLALSVDPASSWRLICAARRKHSMPTFCLATSNQICAPTAYDPRLDRLREERVRLNLLNVESETVRVEEKIDFPEQVPERYIVTFLCRGIIGIDEHTKEPRYGTFHQAELYCSYGFPSDAPRVRWITDIWHPNIRHNGDKAACINAEQWLACAGLVELCYQLFQMIQYNNYHAELYTKPRPLDFDAARWVLDYAEPRHIVNKKLGISVDHEPFYGPPGPKIRVHSASDPVDELVPKIRMRQ